MSSSAEKAHNDGAIPPGATDTESRLTKSLPTFSATEHGYMLQRTIAAASRLNGQHYLWKESSKYTIDPIIAAAVRSQAKDVSTRHTVRVADVGCGTCSWLIDAALEEPDWAFTGFDIDLTQAPPMSWQPNNIQSLNQLNVLQEIPLHFRGAFDVVHLRLLIMAVENGDPRPVLRNLVQLLRPGGWIQWEEVDVMDQRLVFAHERSIASGAPPPPRADLPRFNQLMMFIEGEGRHAWVPQLADIMCGEGLSHTKHIKLDDPPHTYRANSDNTLLVVDEFVQRLRVVKKEEDAMETELLLQSATEELTNASAAWLVRKVLSLGQTPTN